ncbi:MAG: high-potential iron-sulfur protein [Pseudomonadales bacterium]|nr:high-potential iron-sulfur protein [Pseudomonadales bacterium]
MDEQRVSDPRRRRFLKLSTGALVLVPLVQLYGCSRGEQEAAAPPAPSAPAGAEPPAAPAAAEAPVAAEPGPAPAQTPDAAASAPADMPRVSEDEPTAQALGYRHAASDVDQARFPRFQAGQNCANCNLFQPGADASWGGCPIFMGRLVNAAGWCNSWVPKV